MARVEVSTRALRDLERLFDFLAQDDPVRARTQLLSVRRAFELLGDHPHLGRPAEEGRRELLLSRGRDGYAALYRWFPAQEVVMILAVKHQREAGYSEDV
jgi:plasmid stabilization system protein ParE